MKIKRYLIQQILSRLHESDKAIILYGPRQVGKTTLCRDVMSAVGLKTLYVNADETRYIDVLSSRDARKLTELVSGYELVVIDEAQRVLDIGINLKILIDAGTGVKVIATGSSSFDLANKVQEPLTGRHWTYLLYPVSHLELREHYNPFELRSQLEERLIWGSYPEVFSLAGSESKTEYLRTLASDYLYKDIVMLADVRSAGKIRDLLKLIAFQVGSEVSLSELAVSLEMSKETVARYIDLLEKSFVLYRLGGFSRNLRKEISKSAKYYFYDTGVRNSIIDNFKPLDARSDTGALWENFFLMERVKYAAYRGEIAATYFWRTYDGAEIDFIEEHNGMLRSYEAKWGGGKMPVAPRAWRNAYPNATFEIVHRDNYLNFIL